MPILFLEHFGTHYLSTAELGSRITVTSFLTEEATELMSQDKIKGCISASVNVEYFGSKGILIFESGSQLFSKIDNRAKHF